MVPKCIKICAIPEIKDNEINIIYWNGLAVISKQLAARDCNLYNKIFMKMNKSFKESYIRSTEKDWKH